MFLNSAQDNYNTEEEDEWNDDLFLDILESMQLLPRGLGGGSSEKIAPPPEAQDTPPALPPKPQVRIQSLYYAVRL